MLLYEDIPDLLKQRYWSWDEERQVLLTRGKKWEGYYYNDIEGTGTNYTQAQIQKIEETTGIPVTINYVHPIINQKLAILVQNKPSHKVVALDDRGKNYVHVLNKCNYSVMYNSSAVSRQEESVKNMLIFGMGITGIFKKEYSVLGDFGIEYKNLHPSLVLLDANSMTRDNNDMEGFFIEREYTMTDGQRLFGGLLARVAEKFQLENLALDTFKTSGFLKEVGDEGRIKEDWTRWKIQVREYYDKVFTTMYYVPNENGDIERMFAENLEEEERFLLDGAIDAEQNIFVRKTLIIGDKIVEQSLLPITKFPIKVKYFEWAGRPYRCKGVIHFIAGMQDAYDKTIQMFIKNGMLTNNAGYLAPVGSIPENLKKQWENEGNKPGVIKEFVLMPSADGKVYIPQREQIQPLSNFYPVMMEMFRTGMEYSTGINPIVQGNPNEGKVDVFSSLQQYQNAAMQRISLALQHINEANEYIGNVVTEYLLAEIRPNEVYPFFDENDKLQEVSIAKEMAQDFKLAKYKVLSISAEAMPSQRNAMAIELMKIAQTTQNPAERDIFVKEAFAKSGMKGFDELAEQLDTVKQLQSQLQAMQEEIERSKELIKQFENRALDAEFEAKLVKRLSQVDAQVISTGKQAEKEIEIEKLKTQLKEARGGEKKNEG